MSDMAVIAISGKAQHGKDTFAEMVAENLRTRGNRVLVIHYADALKFVCKEFFGWNGKKNTTGRKLLQHVGTDVVRKKNPSFWANFVAEILSFFPNSWDYVLIPDVRFPNEIRKLEKNGLDVVHVRVVRPNFDNGLTEEQQQHESETAMDGYEADWVIVNDGRISGLRKKAASFIEGELYGGCYWA